MKARYLTLTAVPLLILIFTSITCASLEVNVSVVDSDILPRADQNITAMANERGYGIILVLQPAEGTPWVEFLNAHLALNSLYISLPSDIKTELVNKIGEKIVSFKMVYFPGGGGSETVVFPKDFDGVNGEPSTELMGEYKVFFAYVSWEREYAQKKCYLLVDEEFDCTGRSWFVIPEVPLGTLVSLVGMFAAIPVLMVIKRRKIK